MSTLILTLPLAPAAHATHATHATQGPEYDYVRTTDGQQATAQGRAAVALLPATGARVTEVVAVVPARALSWHHISLPERVLRSMLSGRIEPARARSVLAGVLEEQLLDDSDTLHFAVFGAPPAAAGDAPRAWVAVCDRAWLQNSLQTLESAGLDVSRIVAECTPMLAGSARALLSDAMSPAQMLLCTAQGVSLLPWLPATLALAQAQTDLEVLAEPAVMALAEAGFGTQAVLQTRDQRLLQAAQSPWNLAQLELSASSGGRLRKRLGAAWQQVAHSPQWRPARWVLMSLVIVQILGLNALAWRQRSLLEVQRAAMQSMLQQSFPEVALVIDAPLQMQRAVDDLARARGLASDADLGRVFAIIGPLAPKSLGLNSIEWSGQNMLLQASGLDAGTVQPLSAALEARGLRARLQDGQLSIAPKEAR
jgi:general secretion pathway protein L